MNIPVPAGFLKLTITTLTRLALVFLLNLTSIGASVKAANVPAVAAAEGLLSRMVPELVGRVEFRLIPNDAGEDVFELQMVNGRLIVGGNNAVSMASGLNSYLKYSCNAQVSLKTVQLKLPKVLPERENGPIFCRTRIPPLWMDGQDLCQIAGLKNMSIWKRKFLNVNGVWE